MSLPRIYLIDASIYVFRAWHVYETSITDRDGRPANAVFGFSDFLYQLLRQKQPQYIACAFDASQKDSFRKEIFPAYKANRQPAPEELKHQFAQCRAFCRAVGIAAYDSERYEADDIIGTLASHYRRQGFAITVVSADKDLMQLVGSEHDLWWDFARGLELDTHGVKRHFGVRPDQIADMLALSGDKIDNIPGIPGIGYSTAAKLLQRYDSVESLLANHDKIAQMKFRGAARIQALLSAQRHLLPRNKQLTTIATDMPFSTPPELRWRGMRHESFEAVSDQLNFRGAMQQRWHALCAAVHGAMPAPPCDNSATVPSLPLQSARSYGNPTVEPL